MITLSVKKVTGLRGKILGLIGKDKPEALMLTTRFGIHTFGVKFPIDVLILNKKDEIAVIKENLMPNRIFLWNPLHNKVLELPTSTIEKKKIKLKDRIKILWRM